MKRLITGVCLLCCCAVFAQPVSRPKLVVGIVVDQMRWDYLYRFYERYSAGGFKRLLKEGFSCENTFIPYTPTHTAPGHTCIYSGSVPAFHGIVGNNWYSKQTRKLVYCTDDASVQGVGTTSDAGRMSPKNLWANTITDELRLATNFQNKTISIALKDRASILPGGHTSNGSYWFDNASGGWISSTFYMQQLPQWMQRLNARKLPDSFLSKNWASLYALNTYKQSSADSNAYEGRLGGEDLMFPHITASMGTNKYEVFRTTPSGNTFTFETAKEAIIAEQLGKRGTTDFLAVSFSSTDYIGHAFGPNSVEIEDTYLRFDNDLAAFLQYLDAHIGKGEYLLFLTADHGVANNSQFMKDNHLPTGEYDNAKVNAALYDSVEKVFGSRNIIAQTINYQIYLDDSILLARHTDKDLVKQYIIRFLQKQPAVSQVIDLQQIGSATLPQKLKNILSNSYNQKLSGDVQIVFKPQLYDGYRTGATHGLWNPYDAHIPLLWFGWNIKPGQLNREVYMCDIAPTVAALLKVQMPNAAIGNVIEEVVTPATQKKETSFR